MMTCGSLFPRQPPFLLFIFVIFVVRECAWPIALISENFAVVGILRVEEGERAEGNDGRPSST
jgi:hypothetical protein